MQKRLVTMPMLAIVLLISACLFAPAAAYASSPTIYTPTKAEDTAYNRCVGYAYHYALHPTKMTVNISDLNLTQKQVIDLETRLHSNGELWWIDTFNLGLSTSKIIMPCKYSDATINSMRKKFEAAVKTALKRVGPGMATSAQVHMMHDYIIKTLKYTKGCKNAYEALVNKRGDCFGYALGTDVLLRRLGLDTDIAFNNDEDVDHSWNLVRIGSAWYHLDTTWDRYYTVTYYGGEICHKWLLQPDSVMSLDDHAGWEAHHRCTNGQFKGLYIARGGKFSQHCNDYKSIVRTFWKGKFKYKVTGVGKVSVLSANYATRKKATMALPATVKYKGVTYKVTGITPQALKTSKAKTLYISSTALVKANLKNCLTGSKVTKVIVNKNKLSRYKTYFTVRHCGKSVKVTGTTAKKLAAATV